MLSNKTANAHRVIVCEEINFTRDVEGKENKTQNDERGLASGLYIHEISLALASVQNAEIVHVDSWGTGLVRFRDSSWKEVSGRILRSVVGAAFKDRNDPNLRYFCTNISDPDSKCVGFRTLQLDPGATVMPEGRFPMACP